MSVTVDKAINDLGGTGGLSAARGVSRSTVSTWRARGFIPAWRWSEIVRLADERGCSHITFEALAALQSLPESVEGRE